MRRSISQSEAAAAKLPSSTFKPPSPRQKKKLSESSNGNLSAEETLESWVEDEARPDLELDYHLLRGNTGFTACEFIQSSGTDLVVMPSQMPSSDQPVFAPALDWIIQVIPGNLWVIRQTEN